MKTENCIVSARSPWVSGDAIAGASILAKFVLFEFNHVVVVIESQYRESDFYDLG